MDLHHLNDESIDLICTHPPYAKIIKYMARYPLIVSKHLNIALPAYYPDQQPF